MTPASICLLSALGCAVLGLVLALLAGERGWQRGLGGVLCGAAVALVGYVAWNAPSGDPPAGAAYRTVLLEDASYRRLSWAGLVPERDRRTVPLRATAYLRKEPRKSEQRAEADALDRLYDAVEADAEFSAAGSPAAVSRGGRHLHRYFPAIAAHDPVPVLLVVTDDRSQLVAWHLTELADRVGVALVIARSRHDLADEEGLADVHAALSWTMNQPEFRRDRVVLAAGGDPGGAEAVATTFEDSFRGQVFIATAPELSDSKVPSVYLVADADFQAVTDVAAAAGGRAHLIPDADSDPWVSAPAETVALIEQALDEML
ncbi:MAG: hypothetical protein GY898_15280 [Proteobacteria bacterium]|nr:hypothetical protein [Pseudomonadota bacterium]